MKIVSSSPLDLLIVGAGPYGLSLAARAARQGLRYSMLGEPMQFWHKGMPEGMLLRSGDDWQLDPEEKLTYREHARRHSLPLGEPIPLLRFVDYANALAGHYQLTNDPRRAVAITREQTGYQVRLEDGEVMRAARVAICVGFGPFPNQDHALARIPRRAIPARLPISPGCGGGVC